MKTKIKQKGIKKCKYCKKVLRGYNKSNICSSCRNSRKFLIKKKKFKYFSK